MSARCIFFICCSLGDGLVIYLWCTCGLWWTCGFIWMDLSTYYYICDIYCDECDMCGWICGWMRYICDGWDIYVIYVCMNVFVMMECKNKVKFAILGHFAECCTRQRTPLPSAMVTALGKARKMGARKTIFPTLPSAMTMVLGKDFFLKKFKLCRVPARGHSAKIFF